MAAVALDADVLIAFLDASDAQHQRAVDALRPRLAAGAKFLIAASVYAEILVRPLRSTAAWLAPVAAPARCDFARNGPRYRRRVRHA